MTPIDYTYPFDPNGVLASNQIVGERHTITLANGQNFNFLIPDAAPYFENSMIVRHVASGQTLVKNVDWVPSYKFEAASNTAPFLQVYGAVSLLTTAYSGGTLELEYQTIGGAYVLSESALTTVLANTTINPRTATWESVTLKPGIYLPSAHLHNAQDTVGYSELVASVDSFKDTYVIEATRIYNTLMAHINDTNNPHALTLAQLGIERFANIFLANIDNINSQSPSATNYVSAQILKYYLNDINTRLNNVSSKGLSSDTDVLDKLGYITPEGVLNTGEKISHYSQSGETVTFRGHVIKSTNTTYDIRSEGSGVSNILWLGDQAKRHAAVRAENSGAIGFTNAAGALVAYLDSSGVLQHSGINRTSDITVKDIQSVYDYDSIDVDQINLFNWIWKDDERIPENKRSQADTGVIAQDIQKVFPNCVSVNSETGLLTIDDSKLAVHLSIVLLKQMKKIAIKE